jgi:hypothetical protein
MSLLLLFLTVSYLSLVCKGMRRVFDSFLNPSDVTTYGQRYVASQQTLTAVTIISNLCLLCRLSLLFLVASLLCDVVFCCVLLCSVVMCCDVLCCDGRLGDFFVLYSKSLEPLLDGGFLTMLALASLIGE